MKTFIDSLLTSSEDASKFSARYQGMMTAVSGVAVVVLSLFGVSLTQDMFMVLVAQTAQVGGAVIIVAGFARTVYGFIRQVTNVLGKKYLNW